MREIRGKKEGKKKKERKGERKEERKKGENNHLTTTTITNKVN